MLLVGAVAAVGARHMLSASDHRDSALLTSNPAEDIADVYTFQSPATASNLVLALTVSGFIPPSEAGTTYFDPDVLYQIRIDNTGDAVEDLVIQAYVTGKGADQVMHFIGPVAPTMVGAPTQLVDAPEIAAVGISTGATPKVTTSGGVKVFAGVRDDPFFFDLVQYKHVIAGDTTAFRNPGSDTFAGFNVLAIVIELPTTMLGSSPNLGVWGTTNRL